MKHLTEANIVPNSKTSWSLDSAEILDQLGTSPQGLTNAEAIVRIKRFGFNRLKPEATSSMLALFVSQFKSPIILILIIAAVLSFFLHDPVDASIILLIVAASGLLGFWQEYGAARAVAKLLATVQVKTKLLRDGQAQEFPVADAVPGDVVVLSAGDLIPADCLLLEAQDLYADEATLTGETYPAEKSPGAVPLDTPLGKRRNTLFMGTHVISGTGKAVVVNTGSATEFGQVSERLKLRPPETDFERGVRRFGYLLAEVTLVIVMGIFAFNVYFQRPVLDSFLFALALAVGLTPQLLPVIIMVNLAHGARRMAEKKVIVKRLASIENFGSMNVLCSDKTGTLTEGKVQVHSALGIDGKPSEKVLLYAYLNANFETGFVNPIDRAIREHSPFDVSAYRKHDELPYDFIRKRLSILVETQGRNLLVTKGALSHVLEICSRADSADGSSKSLETAREQIDRQFHELSSQGLRVLGVASRELQPGTPLTRDHETEMTFLGFVVLFDPLKPGSSESIQHLNQLGIRLKLITGDNPLVAAYASQQVGLQSASILSGPDLHRMSDEALLHRVNEIDVFAEVEPNQKERIILALKKAGNVVGYIGDGINDASAMHAADVGISVEGAVDVAKEAADMVLLEKDLGVLAEAVREGRRTFANTLKYVFMATSANFGNMFSMAGASLFLPFLPMLPKQILLLNLLTDLPEMTIATDAVDDELVEKPQRWDIGFIRSFMLWFGILSSMFDFVTFGVLMLLRVTPEQFRTAWFVESVISAALTVLVVRTRRPFFQSLPGNHLLIATLAVVGVTLVLPFTPLAAVFGFVPLPPTIWAVVAGIIPGYVIAAEVLKKFFYAGLAETRRT